MKLKKNSLNFLLIILHLTIAIQNATAQIKINEKFSLDSEFGDRQEYNFKVYKEGYIKVDAIWAGTARELALILNGPGQRGYYQRKDGRSPLAIRFKVTNQLLNKGNEWKISIVNFSRKGPAKGSLTIEYPSLSVNVNEIPRNKDEHIADEIEIYEGPGNTTERTILEDGTVRITYPDGTIKLIRDGGYTIIPPNGEEEIHMYSQVQPDTPPGLPRDSRIIAWLEWQNEQMLNFIKKLVGNNESAIQNYLNQENEVKKSIYEKMYLRTMTINKLITPQ